MKPEVRRLLASLPKSEEAERLFHPERFTRDGNPITEVERGMVWYTEGHYHIGQIGRTRMFIRDDYQQRLRKQLYLKYLNESTK